MPKKKRARPGPKVKHPGKLSRPTLIRFTPKGQRAFDKAVKASGLYPSDWVEDRALEAAAKL